MITPNVFQQINEDRTNYKEYNFDLNSSKNKGGFIEGVESLKIWISKALKTERYKHLIYSWEYGSEASSLIGIKASKGFLKAELKRYVEECLSVHEDIKGIKDFSIQQNKDVLTVNLTIITKFGEVSVTV